MWNQIEVAVDKKVTNQKWRPSKGDEPWKSTQEPGTLSISGGLEWPRAFHSVCFGFMERSTHRIMVFEFIRNVAAGSFEAWFWNSGKAVGIPSNYIQYYIIYINIYTVYAIYIYCI